MRFVPQGRTLDAFFIHFLSSDDLMEGLLRKRDGKSFDLAIYVEKISSLLSKANIMMIISFFKFLKLDGFP